MGTEDNDRIWQSVLLGLGGPNVQPTPSLGISLPGLNSSTLDQPPATRLTRIQEAEDRFDKRLKRLTDILPIRNGRVVPEDDDLLIGDARRLTLAVLFLDICGFSLLANEDPSQQDTVLKIVNLFMAEMLQVVKIHEGDFEKNTGDGLMAYFKCSSEVESTQHAVEAAVTMHCYNDQVISPRFKEMGLPEIKFRVGIEVGSVTIAKVGIHGGSHRSMVAIGTPANIACKLMTLIPNGGIVVGDYIRGRLSESWKQQTSFLGPLPNFVLKGRQNPYPAWELKYRAPKNLPSWALGLGGILGGK